ncbi:MAG: DUF6438 domain-containing protein [Vulcanimicrobiaceae bacterium]
MHASLLALCLALLAACGAPPSGAITKIVLSQTRCVQGCRFAQYAFFADGRFNYTDGLEANDIHANISPNAVRTLAEYLVKLPAFGPRWDYAGDTGLPMTYIWIEAGSRHWQVRFPAYSGLTMIPTQNRDVYELNRWSDFASSEGESAVFKAREPIVRRLRNLNQLMGVTFDSNGCYGTCPAYIATFRRNGSADIRNARFVTVLRGRAGTARVTFDHVTAALREAGVETLLPRYDIHTVDTYGIAIHLRFADGFTYDISAPDNTSWPPRVAQLAGAFNQLVRDTPWNVTNR